MKSEKYSHKKRTSPKITNATLKRLAAYSATASAAVLAAPTANAAIHNITTFSFDGGNTFDIIPPDVIAGSPGNFYSTLFIGAPAGFQYGFSGGLGASRFTNSTVSGGIANGGFANIYANNTSVLATYSGYKAMRLSFDAPIAGTMRNFQNGSLSLAFKSTSYDGLHSFKGSFLPSGNNAVKTGYIGFRYIGSTQTYYGWLRVKVANDGTGSPAEVTLVDKNGDGIYGAFGSVGDNIKAGEIASVPEPSMAAIGGLGLLALGAAGVRELRRRRQQAVGN